jgi:hypothetical protein
LRKANHKQGVTIRNYYSFHFSNLSFIYLSGLVFFLHCKELVMGCKKK